MSAQTYSAGVQRGSQHWKFLVLMCCAMLVLLLHFAGHCWHHVIPAKLDSGPDCNPDHSRMHHRSRHRGVFCWQESWTYQADRYQPQKDSRRGAGRPCVCSCCGIAVLEAFQLARQCICSCWIWGESLVPGSGAHVLRASNAAGAVPLMLTAKTAVVWLQEALIWQLLQLGATRSKSLATNPQLSCARLRSRCSAWLWIIGQSDTAQRQGSCKYSCSACLCMEC